MPHSTAKSRTLWDEILGEMRQGMNPHSYDTWLRPTRQQALDAGTLTVAVPTSDHQRVGERFGPQIDAAIHRLHLEASVQHVAFVSPAAPQQRVIDWGDPDLKPDYTFENFVVGGSNQFAAAAAQAVAERPGRVYNPLFLHGGVGLGKTHLMHALGHKARKIAFHLRIEYITAEIFTNQMISALRNDGMIAFRDRYRSVDVLLIDDIQFIANKERIQEEFFHTFNALHSAGKQIVISSDRHPRELSQLEERMRSRFEMGLTSDLQPPDLETRIAILMEKAQVERNKHRDTPEITTEVAEFVASKIRTNIRELEGALVRLLAYCALKGLPLTLATAHEALKNLFDQQQRKLDIEIIAKAVADSFNLRVADLKARNNSRHIVVPRQVAMYLTRQLIEVSLPEIARFYGGKHHSTVIHSIRKIEQEKQTNQALAQTILKLTSQLN